MQRRWSLREPAVFHRLALVDARTFDVHGWLVGFMHDIVLSATLYTTHGLTAAAAIAIRHTVVRKQQQ